MIFRKLGADWKAQLQIGEFRIPEYRAGVTPQEFKGTIVVPGLAFSHLGGRLGRGKGFYDRFLAGHGATLTKIGVGWGFQVLSSVPEESHDVRMDYLCTENGVLDCHSVRTS